MTEISGVADILPPRMSVLGLGDQGDRRGSRIEKHSNSQQHGNASGIPIKIYMALGRVRRVDVITRVGGSEDGLVPAAFGTNINTARVGGNVNEQDALPAVFLHMPLGQVLHILPPNPEHMTSHAHPDRALLPDAEFVDDGQAVQGARTVLWYLSPVRVLHALSLVCKC